MKGCSFSAGVWDDETQAAIPAGENQLPFVLTKAAFLPGRRRKPSWIAALEIWVPPFLANVN